MTDNERKKRDAEQSRALDVHRPSGAMIYSDYLERRQEVIPVNRNDLEDILGFDAMEAFFVATGLFFLSGGVWLGAEKLLEQTQFAWTPVLVMCVMSTTFGAIFTIVGGVMRWKKRGRITRIFSETKRHSAANIQPTRG